jgi:hypothetical protein
LAGHIHTTCWKYILGFLLVVFYNLTKWCYLQCIVLYAILSTVNPFVTLFSIRSVIVLPRENLTSLCLVLKSLSANFVCLTSVVVNLKIHLTTCFNNVHISRVFFIFSFRRGLSIYDLGVNLVVLVV